jgi:hypothetical protein
LEQTGNVGFGVERNGRTFLPVPLVYRKLNPESIRQTDIFSGNGSFTKCDRWKKLKRRIQLPFFTQSALGFYKEMDARLDQN